MKRPPIVRGTFHKAREISETLSIPPGVILPLYRVAFHHPGASPGHLRFQAWQEAEGCWRDYWFGSVRTRAGFMEKRDGKPLDLRVVCTACPAPIDYELTYLRIKELDAKLKTLPFEDQILAADSLGIWQLIEREDSPLFDPAKG